MRLGRASGAPWSTARGSFREGARVDPRVDQPRPCRNRCLHVDFAAGVLPTLLVGHRQQRLAADRSDLRRVDEPAWPRPAVRRSGAEEVGREHHVHGLQRFFHGARGVGALGVQDGLRVADRGWLGQRLPLHVRQQFLQELLLQLRRSSGVGAARLVRDYPGPAADRHGVAAVAGHYCALLLPIRLRRHHAAAIPRQRARADQGEGVDDLRPAMDDVRLFHQRDADLGRRVLGAQGCGGLFRWLRHSPRRGHQRVRRRVGDRAAVDAGPAAIRARTACR